MLGCTNFFMMAISRCTYVRGDETNGRRYWFVCPNPTCTKRAESTGKMKGALYSKLRVRHRTTLSNPGGLGGGGGGRGGGGDGVGWPRPLVVVPPNGTKTTNLRTGRYTSTDCLQSHVAFEQQKNKTVSVELIQEAPWHRAQVGTQYAAVMHQRPVGPSNAKNNPQNLRRKQTLLTTMERRNASTHKIHAACRIIATRHISTKKQEGMLPWSRESYRRMLHAHSHATNRLHPRL